MSETRDHTRPAAERERELDHALSLEVAEHEVAALKDAWSLAGSVQIEPDLARGEASDLRRRLMSEVASSPSPRDSRRRAATADSAPTRSNWPISGRFWVSLAAASVVLVALAGYLGTRPTIYHAPVGTITSVELGDGSRVELSPGSQLREPGWMKRGRSVTLTGEAFFDVIKAPETFRVTTREAMVTVLGTRFAVRSWPSEGRTSLYLEEGRVMIESAGGDPEAAMQLKPGESVAVTTTSIAIDPDFSAAAAMDWRTGDFVFVNAPLGQVLDDIGRRFGARISRGSGVDGDRMVNGAFREPSDPAGVLGDLALSLGLNYRETSDGFEVFRP